MDEIIRIKAEIYDHLAAIELHQRNIQEKNQIILNLSQQQPVEETNEQNTVVD